jgi:hypothetical protein
LARIGMVAGNEAEAAPISAKTALS